MIDPNYVAGLFDGEGCVRVNKLRRSYGEYFNIEVSIANSFLPILEEIKKEFGGRINKHSGTNFPVYKWSASGSEALKFFSEITPYSKIKHEQLIVANEFTIRCQTNKYHWPNNPMPEEERQYRNQCFIKLQQLKRISNAGTKNINTGVTEEL